MRHTYNFQPQKSEKGRAFLRQPRQAVPCARSYGDAMTSFHPTEDVFSWGRILRARHDVCRPAWRGEAAPAVAAGVGRRNGVLGVGLRRSCGVSGLNPDGALIDSTRLDRLIAFDPETRLLRAEAGVSFDALLRFLVPRGFFLPVTPDSRHVTLAGAIANDVHGKNHPEAGTFGSWVRRIGLLRPEGEAGGGGVREIELAADDETGLFAATIGGLGLTGFIVWAEFEAVPIPSAFLEAETIPFDSIDSFFALADESAGWPCAAAWIDGMARGDSLGRGLFVRGRSAAGHPLTAPKAGLPFALPFGLPRFVLRRATASAANALYHAWGRRRQGVRIVPYSSFFHPLDAIDRWNRLYGRRGAHPYQAALPASAARGATRAMLDVIATSGEAALLGGLKTFGDRPSPGLLSFPIEGVTLTFDFPNRGERTLRLLARLDDIVREAGGRLYPARDGRARPEMFKRGYPAWERFAGHVAPGFSSAFWRRVTS